MLSLSILNGLRKLHPFKLWCFSYFLVYDRAAFRTKILSTHQCYRDSNPVSNSEVNFVYIKALFLQSSLYAYTTKSTIKNNFNN